jgi:hypothetical protein
MGDELASANVNRAYSLSGTSLAIFTFVLFFLYPRFQSGEANALLFQATLIVMGLATFSFAFASLFYYAASLGERFADSERARWSRLGDWIWLTGYVLLFLAPSLIVFSIGLVLVGSVWLTLWVAYLAFAMRQFPRIRSV